MIPVWNVFATASALFADGTLPSFDSRMSAPVSELFFTLAPVTAFFFSCFVPTLFLGSARFAAAKVVPLSAKKSAISAIELRRRKRPKPLVICPPVAVADGTTHHSSFAAGRQGSRTDRGQAPSRIRPGPDWKTLYAIS